ncbi:ROK family transcriptional regulator [Alkalispirochaeta sphaeroplastigenens]|uniref:ROK family transcriptional regulator n=1 Tax=Alkalispirochaeta sphaeroplastigenens TaxID=1187066 RepID=UPI000CD9FE2D|nr:ROK family transcriptional regulator [Alkalispirochaeta sphaeroplastigenens]
MRSLYYQTPSAVALIFHIIRTEGPINRTDIVTRTGLSKSTVSLQINRLLSRGLIREETPGGAGKAKRKLRLELAADSGCVVGVLLGIHALTINVFNIGMATLVEGAWDMSSVIEPEPTNRFIMEKIEELFLKAGIPREKLWGIGIGFPFPVDFMKGTADSPPNVPLWNQYPLRKVYEDHFGCPVLIDNDVNVMALGEGFSGAAQEEKDFIFVKVGTGIGSGLILDGKIYRGSKGCAGDIGHIGIDGETRLCHCGNQGCLEAIAAAPAIAARGLEAAMTGESPLLEDILQSRSRITSRDVGDCAQRGDMASIRIIQESGRKIGSVLAKLVNFANPGAVYIGGGVANSGNLFLSSIRESIVKRSPHLATIDLSIRFSELMARSGPTGAGILIVDELFSFSRFQETLDHRLPAEYPPAR